MTFKGKVGDKVIDKITDAVMTVMEIDPDPNIKANVLCAWTDPTGIDHNRWFEPKELRLIVNK